MSSNIPPPPNRPPDFPAAVPPDEPTGESSGEPSGEPTGEPRAQPAQPEQPTQPAEPEQPEQPAQPAQPEQPAQAEQPTQPTQPAQAAPPTQPDYPEQPDYPAYGAPGTQDGWQQAQPPRPRRKEFVFDEPEPLPTTANPTGPRRPGRDKSVSRTGVIVAAVIVFALLAGGAAWAVGAWSGRDANTPAQAAPSPTSSSTPSPTQSDTPTKTASPTPTDPQKIAAAELKKQSKSDTATAKSELNNKWVPQVGSKRKGMKFAGITWTDQDIWDDFQSIKDEYPDALLLKSEDWKSFKIANFWVTVINKPYDNPDDALDWCRSNGLDGEHCYAKRLSNSHGPDTSSKHQ